MDTAPHADEGPVGVRLVGLETLFTSAQRKEKLWIGLNVLRQGVPSPYADAGVSAARGDTLVARGDRLLNSVGACAISNQWEEARDAFLMAAEAFQDGGQLLKAGQAFVSAARCAEKLGSAVETAADLVKAAESYRYTSRLDAARCLQRAIEIHAQEGRVCKVAKYEKAIAEIHEEIWEKSRGVVDMQQSLLHYREAEKRFSEKGTQYQTERNACLLKAAQFHALLGESDAAVSAFETLNRTLCGDKARADGLFRAMLCYLADVTQSSRLPAIERADAAYDHYTETEPWFQSGMECDLIEAALRAVKKQDVTSLCQAIAAYRACREPEYWRDFMLEKIHKNLLEVLEAIERLTFK